MGYVDGSPGSNNLYNFLLQELAGHTHSYCRNGKYYDSVLYNVYIYIKVYGKCFTVNNLIAAKVFTVNNLKSELCIQCICMMSGG